MNKLLCFIISCFLLTDVFGQDSLQATIVLIGDGGELTNGHQLVVEGVRKTIPLNKNTTVIYLGDNLYKTGLPDDILPTYQIAKAPLDSQIVIAGKAPTNVYFIPGNHDWANGGANGYESILRVQNYIDILGNKFVKHLPRDGCPGPVEVKVNNDIVLLIIDSQWWLHENDKPGVESDCPYKTKAEVITQIQEILSDNNDKLVLFALHHPLRSYGPHGGYFTLKQHLFPLTDIKDNLYIPLPIVGSAYPLTRAVFGTSQDLKHPFYQDMINTFDRLVKPHPNVIFVSGHEHTLQVIRDSTRNYIVSGAGSKTQRVSKSSNTLYATSDNGFVTLTVSKNKNVDVTVYKVKGDSVENVFRQSVLNFSKVTPANETDTLREPDYVFRDSAVISASDKFKKASKFRRFFLGRNYREEWSTPVKFKEFNIRKEQGGFTIKSLGGGKQTKSLRLVDKNGKEWNLRTIEKDPEAALPENFRGTIGEQIIGDVISAANPYAPFVVAPLAKAAGIPAAAPRYFFVPDDPAFGKYRRLFANTVCMLEDREPIPNAADAKSTSKVVNKMLEDNDHHVDQKAVLNARLLDMLIGDWDRHADQWRWGTADTGKGKLYYPVPRDRDQAFFQSNGFLIKFLARNKLQFLEGFNKKFDDIKGFNSTPRDFDRFFMNSLTAEDWKTGTASFTARMTDRVIDSAVLTFPVEVRGLRETSKTAARLKSRRDELAHETMKYYKFISERVTVTGSNENEYFHVSPAGKGLQIAVFSKKANSDSSSLMYRRIFSAKETDEIVLYGLNGNDKFFVEPTVKSPIQLRMIGGKGADTFNIGGRVRKTIYDLSTEKNVILNRRRTDNDFSANPNVLEYNNTGFQYNTFSFPQINFGVNVEDGLLLGLGFSSRTYGFRKEPYASNQKFSTLASLTRKAFRANYEGTFNHVFSKYDVIVNLDYVAPTLNNFFGFGNNSVYDKSKSLYFYRARYKYFDGDVMIRRRFSNVFQFSAGPAYYRYDNDFADNSKRILANPAVARRDSASLFTTRDYAGVRLKFDIRYLNNETLPTRGITWLTEYNYMEGVKKGSADFSDLESHMTIYGSISEISKVSGILRFGGGRVFTDNFEFFQAKTLGFNNYLRGYRRDRFSGQGMLYSSAELRFRLFKSNSYVLPGDVGMLGFYDIGRVYMKGEKSGRWHDSFGGGFYFIPFNVVLISASVAVSPEDRLFNFSIGTKFNVVF